MKLTMLGTGNALVTECYNTCFVLEDQGRCFLVDGGGGNTVLHQINSAGYRWSDMRDIFVTHKHIDHLLGILWMMRVICLHMNRGELEGDVNIYAHDEVIGLLRELAEKLLPAKQTRFIGDRLHLIEVKDGDKADILGRTVTFFDIHSTKAKQFGFCMDLGNGEKLTCCGDEPYSEYNRAYAEGSKWLLHEAYCLYDQREHFNPYKKHHSTVKDACENAQNLGARNLVLYHTEEENLAHRKELYSAEGRQYYSGNLYIPDDLETIEL